MESVDSTNNYLQEVLSKTSPEDGFCVYADYQTDGRGQYGRKWQSALKDNLLVSFVFNTSQLFREKEAFVLHQLSSLSLLKVLKEYLPALEIQVKWPNDIFVKNKKIAGILIQNTFRGNLIHCSIIGIGLNINQELFEENISATSMALEGFKKFDRIEILQKLHDELMCLFEMKRRLPNFDFLIEYNALLYQKDEVIVLEKANGELIYGKLLGVDKEGLLNVELSDQIGLFDWSSVRIKV